MKKWFTETLLNMDSMNSLHKKIFMFWTVKINQDKIWLKDIFTCNFCSCIQSALISVKFHILITSWALLKIQKLIHNCWVNVHSLNHMLISTIAPLDLINILLNFWQEWDKTWQKYQNQRKVNNHQNSQKPQLYIELTSNHSKYRYWNCWEDLFIMDK